VGRPFRHRVGVYPPCDKPAVLLHLVRWPASCSTAARCTEVATTQQGGNHMATISTARAAASQELSERCIHLRQLVAANNTNFHTIGVEYNYIVDNKLAEKAGYKNAPEYLTQQIQELSRSTLTTYGAVARAFTAEVCAQYGVSVLILLLTYTEAAGAELD